MPKTYTSCRPDLRTTTCLFERKFVKYVLAKERVSSRESFERSLLTLGKETHFIACLNVRSTPACSVTYQGYHARTTDFISLWMAVVDSKSSVA
jgi:hypothetical protein